MGQRFRYDPELDEVVPVGSAPKVVKAGAWAQPKHCEAVAVEPEEVPQAMAHDRLHGVPTEYDNDGCPIITGPQHYNDYLKSWGYVNRTSGKGHHAVDGTLLKRVFDRFKQDT